MKCTVTGIQEILFISPCRYIVRHEFKYCTTVRSLARVAKNCLRAVCNADSRNLHPKTSNYKTTLISAWTHWFASPFFWIITILSPKAKLAYFDIKTKNKHIQTVKYHQLTSVLFYSLNIIYEINI